MIDTHCHLNFKAFKDDWREVADRAVEAGVTKMIVVGSDLENSRRAVEMAQQHPAIYAAVGVHPHHARTLLAKSNVKAQISKLMAKLKQLAEQPRVVAIGETGLDYHVPKQSKYPEELLPITEELKTIQRELFMEHLKLAKELNKPLILHSRECGEEVLQLVSPREKLDIRQQADSGHSRGVIAGVFHCFGGSKKYLKRILDAGFYVGFDGDITYVPDRLGVAAEVPLERLLLETDSPLITPEPYRGERNEPKNVTLIAKSQAQVRGIMVEEVGRVTSENAERLFNF